MEREWKIGEDMFTEDNVLDGITFDDIILAVHCNYRTINRAAVLKTAKEILDQRVEDFEFLVKNNWKEIAAAAKKGRE